jgi:hypothetical protein
MNPEPRLGVDIGRVIITPDDTRDADTSFLRGSEADALHTPPNAGAFEALAVLTEAFDGRVWLVSKCGPKIERRSRAWLDHHSFFARTGVSDRNLRFCRERRDKALHCTRLAITHFVDDRADVMRHLTGLVPWLFLFGPQTGPVPGGVTWVRDWIDAQRAVLAAGMG